MSAYGPSNTPVLLFRVGLRSSIVEYYHDSDLILDPNNQVDASEHPRCGAGVESR